MINNKSLTLNAQGKYFRTNDSIMANNTSHDLVLRKIHILIFFILKNAYAHE
jgi:hypothetical protein